MNRHDRVHHRTSGARAYVDLPTQSLRACLNSGDTYAKSQLLTLLRPPAVSDTFPVIGYYEVQPLADLAELDRDA